MNLLAIDTATEKFSIAIAAERQGRRDTWFFEADAGMRHSELAMDCVDMLMRKAELVPGDIGGVVCMGGPGSFTGLRIGFSMAKGLALSLGIPFAPVSTLDCLAGPLAPWPGIAVPVLDAKKRAFFCALYREGERISPDMDATPVEIAKAIAQNIFPKPETEGPMEHVLLFGPGAEMLCGELGLLWESDPGNAGLKAAVKHGKGVRWGNAETLLEMALEKGLFAEGGGATDAGPEYIRKSDAELSKH